MENEKKSFLERLNNRWVTPLFAIVAVIYGFIFKVNNDKLNTLTQQVENELRVKEFDNNLKMTIYSEVKEAIQNKDTSLQNATLIVINEMLKDDSAFREKLKTVLFASSNSAGLIEVQKKIDQFSDEEKKVTQLVKSNDSFRVDVFYLDDLKEGKEEADKFIGKLKEEFGEESVRLRLLPKEVNARNGFRISENQIRYEPGEEVMAEKIKALIENSGAMQLEPPNLLKLNSYKSPNYISVFVRNK